jgi:hypothetical protein
MLPAALPFDYLPRTAPGERIRRPQVQPNGRRLRRHRSTERTW